LRYWASWRFPAPASTSGVHRSVNLDGKWEVEAYAGDVQAIRVDRLVAIGRSWGGVVAHAWTKAHPNRLQGVLLASPSAALGWAWPEMEAQVMRYLRGRVTRWQWLVIGLWSLLAMTPGEIGDHAMGQAYRRMLSAQTGSSQVPEWVRHSCARAAQPSRAALRRRPTDVLRNVGLPAGTPASRFRRSRRLRSTRRAVRGGKPRHRNVDPADCGHLLWHDASDAWRAWLLDGPRACGIPAPEPPSPAA
jgi:pimeloyl-ACP methyl ester carboxylesterase